MESIYMLPVHGSELDRTFSLTVDGIIQTFYVPQNTLSKLPLKLTDVDNEASSRPQLIVSLVDS